MSTDGSPKGRALVTGASSGIGEQLARVMAARGHDLVLTARSEDRLRALAAELSAKHGVRAEAVAADLGRPGGAAALGAELARRGMELEILVNDAGFAMHGPFAEGDAARQTSLLELNVVALTELTRLVLPGLLARGAGRVMNVASTAAFVPGPFMAVYYASKAYVLSFSVALAEEVKGRGVTVTALCPGATRTNFEVAAGVSATRLFRGRGVMSAADVARDGYEGMMAGRAIVVPGLRNRLLAGSSRLAPRTLQARIARALQDPADVT
ncbi:MAG TPA: SDR family oxidoreductase [Anaeromyxobacteraceae bacterium]|nr:SDR family oxidoreductase [Anaeromyxobacteraceae bacterium]